jgi:hypothetical protein
MAVIVVLMVQHRLILARGYRQLADQAPTTAPPADPKLAERVNRAQILAAALVAIAIYVMAAKPFA